MEKIDARKLTPREITEKRKIVVKLREKGMSNNEVAQIVGISPQTTSLYYSNYKKYGKDSFKVKYAGRPKGAGKRLSAMEEKRIIRLLIDKTPKQLKFKFALWTREAVKQLIKQELKKSCLSLLLILDMNIEY